MYNILVIDDEINSLEICQRKLSKTYHVVTADNPQKAKEILRNQHIHCIISDLVMPSVNGLEFIQELQKEFASIPLLVMSGKATVNMAVEAMKAGALDFIEKPFVDLEILPVYVKKALSSSLLVEENESLKKQLHTLVNRCNFIGNAKPIQAMLHIIHKVAKLNTTILIEGETGSGKEMVARLIHQNSDRNTAPFVTVNCGAIPDTLLESLLFGHAKGAFTGAHIEKKGYFEEAHNGTLFLDEIGEVSTAFQVKLLRVLQERKIRKVGGAKDIPVNVRIITATNRDLKEEVKNEHFRKDLFYRLNVIKIKVPSLNERRDDIPLLAKFFLEKFMNENNLSNYVFHKSTMKMLMNTKWEGNIRELQNVVEYAAAMTKEKEIMPENLPSYLVPDNTPPSDFNFSINYEQAKEEFRKIYFTKLLEESNGNVSEAARISGIARQNIYHFLKKMNLEKKEKRENRIE